MANFKHFFTKTCISTISVLFTALFLAGEPASAKDYSVKSPDGKITVNVSVGPEISWSASYEGSRIVESARVGLELENGTILGRDERVRRADTRMLNEVIRPVVPNKRSEITDNCNILDISFRSGLSVQFRAYNDGVAYRFVTGMKNDLVIGREIAELAFPGGSESWYPLEESFFSHNERQFIHARLDTINKNHLASLPALFRVNGINVLLTESDIEDYPGMWLRGQGSGKIMGVWPEFPEKEVLKGDRDFSVAGTKGYIAQTKGTRTFPWRVFVISPNDVGLIGSDLVFRLAKPSEIKDPSWIKPGQVAWDWWNANNVYGVDFRAGINNDTYKHYIDFAADNGLEYIILDEGWYENADVTREVKEINVRELCEYGKSRNVGVILWVVWKSFWDKIDESLALYEKWGVAGLKIDFMQRDDQKVVNFYHETARKAAEHKLLLDFHGAYKPDGISRTWPNIMTREGVKGLEWCKWSRDVGPEHDVTIPFTRMVAGPMDYTPGAMVNMDRTNFTPKHTRPQSQGTRAHQVAMYVIYESPLQMLSDSPSNYMKEPETTEFIRNIPVVWDDIACLDGKVGDYVVLARRSGREWFAGALTDWTARTLDVDLSFLPSGSYNIEIYQDGINADRHASDYKMIKSEVRSGEKLKIQLAPGGGWAARITPR